MELSLEAAGRLAKAEKVEAHGTVTMIPVHGFEPRLR